MNTINQFLLITLCCAFLCCKAQQKNNEGPQVTSDPTVYNGVTNDSCAVEMAFGSPGSGIDGNAYNLVMAEIEKNKLHHTAKVVGREGEIRICLPLEELKKKEKERLITDLKKIAKEGQLVSISIR